MTEPTYTDDDLAAAEAELAEEEATEPAESTTDEAPDEALEDKP